MARGLAAFGALEVRGGPLRGQPEHIESSGPVHHGPLSHDHQMRLEGRAVGTGPGGSPRIRPAVPPATPP
eukprot:6019444-Pyramimonas_sp.AAC.1